MSPALQSPRPDPVAIAPLVRPGAWIFFLHSTAGFFVLKVVVQLVVNAAVFFLEEDVMPDARAFVALRDEGFRLAHRSVALPRLGLEDPAPPVILVDISRLQRVDFLGQRGGTFAPKIDYTPRPELTRLLRVLQTNFKPAAIGIDVDFSPDSSAHGGRTPRGQDELLEFCLERAQLADRGLASRIFLGVGRSSGSAHPSDWLGSPDYASLAATAVLLTDEAGITPPVYSLIPSRLEFRSPSGRTTLPSLSSALTDAYRERHPLPASPGPPAWLQRFADETVPLPQPAAAGHERHIEAFQINYAQVDLLRGQIVDAELLLSSDRATLADLEERFRERIVLIGAADFRRAPDKVVMPNRRELIPGIYAHAAGVLTQLQSPLWRLSKSASILLSLVLSLGGGVLAILAAHRWTALGRGPREELIAWLLTFLLILLVAPALARWGNVLWIGAIGTAVGACIEIFFVLFFVGHLQPAGNNNAPSPP